MGPSSDSPGSGPRFLVALNDVLDAIERARVPYMVIGYVAVSAYGAPRATKDVDVSFPVGVALRTEAQLDRLIGNLGKSGIELPPKGVFLESLRGGRKRVVGIHRAANTQVDLFFWQIPRLDPVAFRRRRTRKLFGRRIWVPSAEDEILYKLDAARRKDLDDAVGIIVRQGKRLDTTYLQRRARDLGLKTRLDSAVREARAAFPFDI